MTHRIGFGALLAFALSACGNDFQFQTEPPPPPAQPPGDDDEGDAPDWTNCQGGWIGNYANLVVTHPDVTPRPNDPPAGTNPTALDWWDRDAYEDFDATLDFGQNWWPVDEGLEDDPAYFAVYWHAWIRALNNTTFEFVLGSSDDSWVWVDGAPIAEKPGIHDFERETYAVGMDAGQYPIEVWFAHRASAVSSFSFRPIPNEDILLCHPDFGAEE